MLRLENISVVYDKKIRAVDDVSIEVPQGDILGIIGSSGSGKSSLLKTINLLNRPSSGHIYLDEKDITDYKGKNLRNIRREIGFVFQDYNLIEKSSVLQNVLIGRLGYKSSLKSIFGIFNDEDYESAMKSLKNVGLTEKVFSKAEDLSGGQKQRVAIAKTICQRPKIILADEPVSSLDIRTSEDIMDYFKKINAKKNITIIINLHDVNLAKKYCNNILALKMGKKIFHGSVGELDDRVLEEIYN